MDKLNGIKHDKGKPAYHLIDPGVLRSLAVAERDPPPMDSPEAYLTRWWAHGAPDSAVHSALLACAHLLGTYAPIRTARLELARVLAWGHEVKGYPANNWREGFAWSRLFRAAVGHIAEHRGGVLYDHESGYLHLSHAMSALMFLSVHVRDGLGMDDRIPAASQDRTP